MYKGIKVEKYVTLDGVFVCFFLSLIFLARRSYSVRARLHGKRVPLAGRGTLFTRVEDTVVLHGKFERGRGTLPRRVKRL